MKRIASFSPPFTTCEVPRRSRALPRRRPSLRPRASLLESNCKPQQFAVITSRCNELNRERHTGTVKSGGQADCRIAGEIVRHRVGIPRCTDVLDLLAVDLDRAEEVLID